MTVSLTALSACSTVVHGEGAGGPGGPPQACVQPAMGSPLALATHAPFWHV